MNRKRSNASRNPLPWLLASSQPWVRYHALRDLEGHKEGDPEVREARAAIIKRGWVADLLARQTSAGRWGRKRSAYSPKYTGTNWKWLVLAELGVDRTQPGMKRTCQLILDEWTRPDGGFDDVGETGHFCITGNAARALIQAGYASDQRVRGAVDWLLRAQLPDGGWDCFGRGKGTLDCWEALSAFAALPPSSRSPKVREAIERGSEFYLSRGLLKEGPRSYAAWRRLHYPRHYYYDLLVGLELMVALGHAKDWRLGQALRLLEGKQRPDGTWLLEAVHPDVSAGHQYYHPKAKVFSLERKGAPSEILTLRALRVIAAIAN